MEYHKKERDREIRAATWVNLEHIMLSKRHPMQKVTSCRHQGESGNIGYYFGVPGEAG